MQNLDVLTGEDKLQKGVYEKENIEVILGSVVESLLGDTELTGIRIKNDAESQELMLDGIFVAIGLIPQNDALSGVVTLNDYGYVDADENCRTNVEGIFVAGDCRSKRIRQVATACADGAVAALAACDFISE